MIKILAVIVLLNIFQPSIEGVYTQSITQSSIIESVSKRWELTIRHDSTFSYTIHESYSTTDLDSIYTNTGKWTLMQDTLTLRTYTAPYIYRFVVKEDKLIPIGDRLVQRGSLLIHLDYLQKRTIITSFTYKN